MYYKQHMFISSVYFPDAVSTTDINISEFCCVPARCVLYILHYLVNKPYTIYTNVGGYYKFTMYLKMVY